MLSIRNLTKLYYPKRGNPVTALNNINLDIADSGLVFLLGKSGSGKSSLLNIIGGLDTYSDGEIIIKNKSSKGFSKADFDSYRNTFLGFIFQEYYLLEDYTVGKNISLALELQRKKADKDAVVEMLARVDLTDDYYSRKINELSGGQKQRVSIARALVKNPDIILADEPTGALDSKTGQQVFDVLRNLSKQKLIIVVSHDRDNAELYADRIIELADGNVISDRTRAKSGQLQNTPPISWLGDNLVQIQPGYQLRAQDVQRINAMLATNNAVAYISQDSKSNLVFDTKAQTRGLQGTFEGTNPSNLRLKQYSPQDFQLVRSHLPFKDSLKMGASGLKTKPIRLTFLLILSLVSFAMFGMAFTAFFVNSTQMELDYLSQHNRQSIVVRNNLIYNLDSGQYYSVEQDISQDNIKKLSDLTGHQPLNILNNQNVNLASSSTRQLDDTDRYFGSISYVSNFVELPADGSTPSFFYHIAGRLPQDTDEIVITDWMADYFVGYDHIDGNTGDRTPIRSYEDLLNLTLSSPELKIVGVYRTDIDISRFKDTDWTQTSLNSLLFQNIEYTAASMIYVVNSFGSDTLDIHNYNGRMIVSNYQRTFTKIGNINNLRDDSNVAWRDGIDRTNLQSNDIIVPSHYLNISQGVTLAEVKDRLDNMVSDGTLDNPTIGLYTYWDDVAVHVDTVNIVGISHARNTSIDMVLVSNEIFDQWSNVVFQSTNSSQSSDAVMLEISDEGMMRKLFELLPNTLVQQDNEYFVLAQATEFYFVANIASVVENIMSIVFLWIGIVFAVFSSLLFMNFIGVSIYHKKKQIGILRAIGARGRDVFKIFFIEALLIGLIIFVTSSIATFVLSWVVNNGFGIQVMSPNILVIGALLSISVVVALLATWLPVFKIARKKPIDAINNK